MREDLYEESAEIVNKKSEKTKYVIMEVLSYFFWCVFAFIGFFLINFFNFGVFYQGNALYIIQYLLENLLPLIVSLISAILFSKLKFRFYVEYDYIFVSGNIRISKVINSKKRLFLMSFESKEIEKIGKVGSNTFEAYNSDKNVKKQFLTSNDTPISGKDFYYIVINIDSVKNLLIFECTEKMIGVIYSYSLRTVLEKDFKWFILTMPPRQNQVKRR